MQKRILKLLKNKYFIVIVAFVFFFVFIDDNGLVTTVKLQKQLNQLEEKEEYYISEIEKDSIGTIQLNTNIDWIEKYGRENYYMKRNNEDIFIISRSKE